MSTPMIEMPDHLAIGITAHGNGPVLRDDPEFDHWECWCGNDFCALSMRLKTPPAIRKILILKAAGMKDQQIAWSLGIKYQTVKKQLTRARNFNKWEVYHPYIQIQAAIDRGELEWPKPTA